MFLAHKCAHLMIGWCGTREGIARRTLTFSSLSALTPCSSVFSYTDKHLAVSAIHTPWGTEIQDRNLRQIQAEVMAHSARQLF